jgi:antitoxin (DNA-binding transcriptional repressor) of toxin-antitoxin stability system
MTSNSSNNVRYIKITDLRLHTRDVLEAARFQAQISVITIHGQAVAAISPVPKLVPANAEARIGNDLRLKTRQLLQQAQQGQTFVITTHGQPMALVGPIRDPFPAEDVS